MTFTRKHYNNVNVIRFETNGKLLLTKYFHIKI